MKNRILKAGFKVIAVSFERVTAVYWAHTETGREVISVEEYTIMKAEILEVGFYEVKPVYWDDRSLVELLNETLGPDFTL